jgi:hypothetical protein
MTRLGHAAVVLTFALASMAHVGSPDTFFTGEAGPYKVRVIVRLPGVIPGLAQISVRLPGESPDSIRSVTVQAVQWNVGREGAPPPDPAQPVTGDPELFAADLWLMLATSHRVLVEIDGDRGRATAVVPVLALATTEREMDPRLGGILVALAAFLSLGLVTLVGAAVRESVLPPGVPPDGKRRWRARLAMGFAAVLIALVLWGGNAWWSVEASSYNRFTLYRPFAATASVRADGGRRVLTLTIDDERWPRPATELTRYNALMPDHGKLMHMFLVREPALDVFAHVHPVPQTPAALAFDLQMPPIPSGRYRIYADIVHESGYAQTMVAAADVPPSVLGSSGDSDDSWSMAAAVPDSHAAVFTFQDGSTLTWERGPNPLRQQEEHELTFVARGADGSPMPLEPYMGMLGHVAVNHDAGTVFAHLHPSGSISMAALRKFQGDARATAGSEAHAAHARNESRLEIPYAFPRAGRYRLWVQVKRQGEVLTAAFDAQVHE